MRLPVIGVLLLLAACATDLGFEKTDGREDTAVEDTVEDSTDGQAETPDDTGDPVDVPVDPGDPDEESPCAIDTDGDGICDDEDTCLIDGPLFAGIPDSASMEFLAISDASLDGGSNVLTGLMRNERFDLEYDWQWESDSCCTCLTFISYGYSSEPGPDGCQPDFTGCSRSGTFSTTLRAPNTPGTYYLGCGWHWEYACPSSWDAPEGSRIYAAICVE